MALAMLFLSFLFMVMTISSADILENPDFESPPTNVTANTTTPILLLTEANIIPGWSFSGTMWYVSSGPHVSLPENGHALQLGQGGKINQIFKGNGDNMDYVLTLTLAPGGKGCSNNSTAVTVSAPGRSKVFFLEMRYGREMWESHAYSSGNSADERNLMKLEIQSVSMDAEPSATCWPVVDTFLITGIGRDVYSDNLLVNSGFEIGPAFLRDSFEGIILDEDPDHLQSALEQWSIIGKVKYIDSKHYSIPEGKAAIELVSGAPSGIITILVLSKGSKYILEFMMGDANDSCVAEFIAYAQVGMAIKNVTMRSSGTGLSQKYSMTVKADSSLTSISFVSFNESQTSDHVFCGPVIDNVVFRPSYSVLLKLHDGVLIFRLFLTLAILRIGR